MCVCMFFLGELGLMMNENWGVGERVRIVISLSLGAEREEAREEDGGRTDTRGRPSKSPCDPFR